MSGSHRAKLVLEDCDADSIYRCVSPEAGEMEGRTDVELELAGDRLVFELSAPDLVSLRAGVNTWSRFVELAERAFQEQETEV